MQWIACLGVICFVAAWAPQSLDTIRKGCCDANAFFLALMAAGSFSLMAYAGLRGDGVFFSLNFLTTAGAVINLWFKLFPVSGRDGM